MPGKPARIGGASGYIMRAFAKAPQISSPSATTTRSPLFETRMLLLLNEHRSRSRPLSLLGRLAASQQPAVPAAAGPPSEEWTLHPQTVQVIWGIFGRPEVNLIASEDNTHCQTYCFKGQGCVGPRLAQPPPLCFSQIALIPQAIKRIRELKHRVLLVAPLWRNQN